jgi:hypothetical protein
METQILCCTAIIKTSALPAEKIYNIVDCFPKATISLEQKETSSKLEITVEILGNDYKLNSIQHDISDAILENYFGSIIAYGYISYAEKDAEEMLNWEN